MKPIVFLGPTMTADEARIILDAEYLPPVSQGDVYRAALHRPPAIGIVDGYFNSVPAVWHKEILWALAEGIHVFGSASMGALRAAELWSFGMEGVGRVFEAYRDGLLTDDDEVAVAHADGSRNYQALSEPMVNVRATLERAEADGVVSGGARETLQACAKAMFYPERHWAVILDAGTAAGVPAGMVAALERFVTSGRIDQKRVDAEAMLRALRARLADGEPMRPAFRFEHTSVWEQARAHAGTLLLDSDSPATPLFEQDVLDEVRLDAGAYRRVRERALGRLALLFEARRQRLVAGDDGLLDAIITFREERGLAEGEDVERWVTQNHLTKREFLDLMDEQARIAALERSAAPNIGRVILRELRLEGRYEEAVRRCLDKARRLSADGLNDDTALELTIDDRRLLDWYARELLGNQLPPDLASHARSCGFAEVRDLLRALRREWWYCGRVGGSH